MYYSEHTPLSDFMDSRKPVDVLEIIIQYSIIFFNLFCIVSLADVSSITA